MKSLAEFQTIALRKTPSFESIMRRAIMEAGNDGIGITLHNVRPGTTTGYYDLDLPGTDADAKIAVSNFKSITDLQGKGYKTEKSIKSYLAKYFAAKLAERNSQKLTGQANHIVNKLVNFEYDRLSDHGKISLGNAAAPATTAQPSGNAAKPNNQAGSPANGNGTSRPAAQNDTQKPAHADVSRDFSIKPHPTSKGYAYLITDRRGNAANILSITNNRDYLDQISKLSDEEQIKFKVTQYLTEQLKRHTMFHGLSSDQLKDLAGLLTKDDYPRLSRANMQPAESTSNPGKKYKLSMEEIKQKNGLQVYYIELTTKDGSQFVKIPKLNAHDLASYKKMYQTNGAGAVRDAIATCINKQMNSLDFDGNMKGITPDDKAKIFTQLCRKEEDRIGLPENAASNGTPAVPKKTQTGAAQSSSDSTQSTSKPSGEYKWANGKPFKDKNGQKQYPGMMIYTPDGKSVKIGWQYKNGESKQQIINRYLNKINKTLPDMPRDTAKQFAVEYGTRVYNILQKAPKQDKGKSNNTSLNKQAPASDKQAPTNPKQVSTDKQTAASDTQASKQPFNNPYHLPGQKWFNRVVKG